MKNPSNVALNFPKSGIRKMSQLASQYKDVINLSIGDPNFDTPKNIIESAKKALDKGWTHYSPSSGFDELRGAIADKYNKEMDLGIKKENVMITIGGMEALYLALVSVINPGDEIIICDPSYPNYIGMIMLLGAKAAYIPVYEENGFKPVASDLEKAITSKTKAIIINTPTNPVGAVMERAELEEIAKVVKKHDIFVISDEVYEKIIYDEKKHLSMAQIEEVKDNVIITNSFSKTYAMTGWRIGYLVGHESLVKNMPQIQEGVASCVSTFIQMAAIDAIKGPQDAVAQMVKDYARRRDILIDGINAIPGIKCVKSPGSFYAFPNIKAFGKSSEDFSMELLEKARVVVTPGSAFGKNGEGYIRISFANSDENLKEAVKRIKAFVENNYKK